MPRIGKFGYKNYEILINYTSKGRMFSSIMPNELKIYEEKIYSDAEASLVEKFKKIVDKHLASEPLWEKVIVISTECNQDSPFWDDFRRLDGKTSFFNLQWMIVRRMKLNGEFKYLHTKNGEVLNFLYIDSGYKVIKWTQEKEDYLETVTRLLNRLTKNMRGFFNSPNLEELLDQKFLPLQNDPLEGIENNDFGISPTV